MPDALGRIPVDSSHCSLHVDRYFEPKIPEIFYFERFKAQFNPRPTGV